MYIYLYKDWDLIKLIIAIASQRTWLKCPLVFTWWVMEMNPMTMSTAGLLPWFLLMRQQFDPAVFLHHRCKLQKRNVGLKQIMRFNTSIQYINVWKYSAVLIFHTHKKAFTHTKKNILCWFVSAKTRKTSKTAGLAMTADSSFCKVKAQFYLQDINSAFEFTAKSLIQWVSWHYHDFPFYWFFIQQEFSNDNCTNYHVHFSRQYITLSSKMIYFSLLVWKKYNEQFLFFKEFIISTFNISK